MNAELLIRCRDWVLRALGRGVLEDTIERSLRVLEEAAELAQSCGVSHHQALTLMGRVFSRPPGSKESEAAGTFFTLIVWAQAHGVDLEYELRRELARVEDPDLIEHIREKHGQKVRAGIGRPLEPLLPADDALCYPRSVYPRKFP